MDLVVLAYLSDLSLPLPGSGVPHQSLSSDRPHRWHTDS